MRVKLVYLGANNPFLKRKKIYYYKNKKKKGMPYTRVRHSTQTRGTWKSLIGTSNAVSYKISLTRNVLDFKRTQGNNIHATIDDSTTHIGQIPLKRVHHKLAYNQIETIFELKILLSPSRRMYLTSSIYVKYKIKKRDTLGETDKVLLFKNILFIFG